MSSQLRLNFPGVRGLKRVTGGFDHEHPLWPVLVANGASSLGATASEATGGAAATNVPTTCRRTRCCRGGSGPRPGPELRTDG